MDIQEILEKDVFAKDMGITLEQICDQYVKMSLTVEAKHLNAADVVHGGAMFTLADYTMGTMANRNGVPSLSIQLDIRYLAVGFLGDKLTATATEVFAKRSMSHYRVSIENQNGEIIAIAEGMFHRKKNINVEGVNAQ